MNPIPPAESSSELILRPAQFGDLSAIEALFVEAFTDEYGNRSVDIGSQIRRLRKWFGPIKVLSIFPNRFQHVFTVHVAEQNGEIKGVIQVSPFNHARTTWRVDHVAVSSTAQRQGVGSRLLRHCMNHFREARMWLLEVNIHNRGAISLYRRTGFQPLAQITYWSLSPEILQDLSKQEPRFGRMEYRPVPHLVPSSHRDAQLIYQLDTASMPPLVRQTYDRHTADFKSGVMGWALDITRQSISNTERIQAYLYEPERKAAVGYFNLKLSRTGTQPHVGQMIVHPAYTEFYPELMVEMARQIQDCPPQSLALASTDYQPEREEFLLKLGAEDQERTLLMSRSVWHKLRETRVSLENLRLQNVLRNLQVNQPMPERIDWGSPEGIEALLCKVGSLAEWQEERLWSSDSRQRWVEDR
jgi:ribosomal protein S18 acetylase RimI-like enzyme